MRLPRRWNGVWACRWTHFLSTFDAGRPYGHFRGMPGAPVDCRNELALSMEVRGAVTPGANAAAVLRAAWITELHLSWPWKLA